MDKKKSKLKLLLNKSAGNVELGGVTAAPVGFAAFQGALNRLEKWPSRNLVKFSKGKFLGNIL